MMAAALPLRQSLHHAAHRVVILYVAVMPLSWRSTWTHFSTTESASIWVSLWVSSMRMLLLCSRPLCRVSNTCT